MGEKITWEELLGGESCLLIRLGQLLFTWPKDSSIVKIVRTEEETPEEVEVAFEVEVPPSLRQDSEPFMDFCRAFVGIPTEAQDIEALGWLSAELAKRSGAWEGKAPDWFPEPPEWLELWEQAKRETEKS